jgi:outer membrane protein TolC
LAEKRLAQLLDVEGQVKVKQPPDVEMIRFELDEYVLKARDNRPDLAQSVELVRFTEQEANLVKAGGNPDIDLSASYTQYSEQVSSVPERQVSLNFEWPFFQGGLVRLQTKEAFSKVRQSQEDHSKRLKAADLEVEVAFRELASLEAQKDLVESSLANARENYRLARIQFDLGAATDLDVLVAQDGLAESENLAVNQRYNMRTARAALLYSIGVLNMDVFKFD